MTLPPGVARRDVGTLSRAFLVGSSMKMLPYKINMQSPKL
jgi:hypothetical protein